MNEKNEYLIQEMSVLKEDIRFLLGQIDTLERFAILGSGAIWGLVASLKWNDAINIIIWLPVIISLLFSAKKLMLTRTIHTIGEYIKKTEKTFSLPDHDLGWAHYWSENKERSIIGKSYLKLWGQLFWFSLILGNLLIALFFPFQVALVGK